MSQPRYLVQRMIFLTPAEFSGKEYMDAAKRLALPWADEGWAVFAVTDENGERSTLATADPDYMRLAASEPAETHELGDREINNDKIIMVRTGWPEDWPDGSWWLYLPPPGD